MRLGWGYRLSQHPAINGLGLATRSCPPVTFVGVSNDSHTSYMVYGRSLNTLFSYAKPHGPTE